MIDRLKALVLEGGYDEDSKAYVKSLETRLNRAIMAEGLKDHPVIAEYIAYLRQESERITYLLANNEDLTDRERSRLFARREVSGEFLRVFDSEKQEVEEEIKNLIETQ